MMHKPHTPLKHYHLPNPTVLLNASIHQLTHSPPPSPVAETAITKRECILFPTYAFKDPENLDEWIVRTKGWTLSFKKPGPKQRVLKGITKSVAGKAGSTSEMFENRFKYFMAKGKRNRAVRIEAIGAATNAEWIQLSHEYGSKSPPRPSTPHDEPSSEHLSIHEQDHLFQEQWLKACDSTKYHPLEDLNRVGPLPIILNPSYPSSCASSSINHQCVYSDEETEDSSSDDTQPYSPKRQNHRHPLGITLKSESTGVFSGEFHIPDEQVKIWTHNCEDSRMLKIKTDPESSFKHAFDFPPSYGLVQLIEPYGVSVISDIDDTIKDTHVLAGARAVLTSTFFNPTRAVAGMADVYKQWYNQGASYHYVSNSPFQLVHMLHQFISNHHFPPGSFHLRPSTGLISKLVQESGRSKRESICQILRDFPHRKFVLVGDSGEIDLEIYTRIAVEFPQQIIKIFIRDVTTLNHHDLHVNKEKKNRRAGTKRSSTFPSFFASNSSKEIRSESTPNLPLARLPEEEHEEKKEEDEEEDDDNLHDAASKLAELVLEPSLTGHEPLVVCSPPEELSAAELGNSHEPPSHGLIQLFTRLAMARRLAKDVDIVLFKDSKELYDDADVKLALAKYNDKNAKQQ